MKPHLDIRDLTIEYRRGRNEPPVYAVRDLNFLIKPGEIFGLVGSTGSGKTATTLALGGLLPPGGHILSGSAIFWPEPDTENQPDSESEEESEGIDLLALPAREIRKLRRGPLAWLLREISAQLNPRLTIRQHIRESIELAGRSADFATEESWMPIFYEVGLVEPEALLPRFPDQLSEVILQRLLIAMALFRDVKILIADEPTSDLDAVAENQILRLLNELRENRRLTILLVTHDFGILKGLADRVAVMFEGDIVELGPVDQVLQKPKSEYTRALLDCVPKLGERRGRLGEVDHVSIRDAILAKNSKSA